MNRLYAVLLVFALLTGCGTGQKQDSSDPIRPAEPPVSHQPAITHTDLNEEDGSSDAAATPEEIDPAEGATPEPAPREIRLPKICIDPGHYAGVNQIFGEDGYGYVEGDFTLEIGLHLHRILYEKYGIQSVLTRDTGTITLDGYSNDELDDSHLGLRGSYAAEQGCDFFVSLHTNANLENANGYPTLEQPIEITKTIVLANIPCCESEQWLRVANEIGESVSEKNAALGLAAGSNFLHAAIGDVPEWTDAWNDSFTMPGAVLCRHGENGDYYGILRAAAQDGVPGVIIEHGFHTVPQMRYMAAYGDLAEAWAEADADGIAAGLGLKTD